ncbi:MAG: hypothetical protein JWM95_217 [Gemmatimonadetes bacterium]|nr:hypothetical protein [Gemmatimonadota bacterium]
MSKVPVTTTHASIDTSPLDLNRLTDDELLTIFRIEQRFAEAIGADQNALANRRERPTQYLARIQQKRQRALLLDGARGTGKTSLLLTMAERWRRAANLPGVISGELIADRAAFERRTEALKEKQPWITADAPTYVRVLRILDFDPLPPEMPLIAGLVQAWRPLAQAFDSLARPRNLECDDFDDSLMESWHKLFRVAAVGWSAIPTRSGLIEQVLDREDQVENWLSVDEQWQSFVDEVNQKGSCLPTPHYLSPGTVFVIIIDDVDLQVRRIRELLPALRLLYHPRVFFLIAADRRHMQHVLTLEFLGQQNELAHDSASPDGGGDAWRRRETWGEKLADAAFEKVFPTRNQSRLHALSLLEFLAYPAQVSDLPSITNESVDGKEAVSEADEKRHERDQSHSFYQLLNELTNEEGCKAGDAILSFARAAESVLTLPRVITFRAAEQLFQHVTSRPDVARPQLAYEVLSRLLSGRAGADVVTDREGKIVGVASRLSGEIAALYQLGSREFGPPDVLLSARPDFVHLGETGDVSVLLSANPDAFDFVPGLLTKTLEARGFHVDSALIWNTYLSLIWTEWINPPISFSWPRYRHPRPDELFEQTEWLAKFKKMFDQERDDQSESYRRERYAYGWIYLQAKRSGLAVGESLDPTRLPTSPSLDWESLLAIFDEASSVNGEDEDSRKRDFRLRVLPLLGRPEIGLSPGLQKKLCKWATEAPNDSQGDIYERLSEQRERLLTDAFVAAAVQRGKGTQSVPTTEDLERALRKINLTYKRLHKEPSPWSEIDPPDGQG